MVEPACDKRISPTDNQINSRLAKFVGLELIDGENAYRGKYHFVGSYGINVPRIILGADELYTKSFNSCLPLVKKLKDKVRFIIHLNLYEDGDMEVKYINYKNPRCGIIKGTTDRALAEALYHALEED